MQFILRLSLVAAGLLCITSGVTFFSSNALGGARSQDQNNASLLEEATHLRALVAKLYKEGKLDEALRAAKKAADILESVAPRDFKTADALNDLGELYLIQNKNDQAAEAFQRSLKICELNPSLNSLPISRIFERLAKIAFRKSEDANAEDLIRRSLEIRRTVLNKDPSGLANSLIDIARLYFDERRFLKGEGFYVEGLSILEKKLGRSDEKMTKAMQEYACTVLRAGEVSLKPTAPAAPDAMTKALRQRAQCWLYGFDTNCAEEPMPPGEYEPVVNGKATKLAIPEYPRGLARIFGGRVFVAVRIDENGKVVHAKPVCGAMSDLIEPALNAAKASRFTPTSLAGRPVQVNGTIVYNFVPSRR